jgi:hypothetical protein
MSTLIKPLTPLWRPAPTFQCGARCEPIRVIATEDFIFDLPLATDPIIRYGLYAYIGDLEGIISTDPVDGVSEINMVEGGLGMSFGDSGTVIQIPTECFQIALATVTIVAGRPTNTVVQQLGNMQFVNNTCGSYAYLTYQLDCNSPTYTYVLKGGIRRIAPVLSDEVNYTDTTGRNKRIFTRTESQARIYSMPFGWQEHDFLRAILDKDRFVINGLPVQLQEGAAWQPTQADTAYMVGSVDVVTDANISGLCCTEESSL